MARRSLNQLTQRFVEKVLRGSVEDGRYSDGGNLYCLVRTQGTSASWVFLSTQNGKQNHYTIGSVRKLADTANSNEIGKRAAASLKAAREKAAEYRYNIANDKPIKAIIVDDYPKLDEIAAYYCERKGFPIEKMNPYLMRFRPIYEDMGPIYKKEMGVAYRNQLVKEKKAENTISSYLHVMKAMFTTYISDHSVDIVSPFAGVRHIKKEEAVNDRDVMPHDVIKKVYEDIKDDEYRNMWLSLIVTGARLNEIYGIKSSDLTTDGFLKIEPNEKRRLKNAASKRTIPFFIKLPKRQREYYWNDLASISALSQYFQRHINRHIPKELHGTRRITTHSLRHSLTDFMRLKGVQQNIEDMYLGHAAKDTSNRVYGSAGGRKDAMQEVLKPVIHDYIKIIGIGDKQTR